MRRDSSDIINAEIRSSALNPVHVTAGENGSVSMNSPAVHVVIWSTDPTVLAAAIKAAIEVHEDRCERSAK